MFVCDLSRSSIYELLIANYRPASGDVDVPCPRLIVERARYRSPDRTVSAPIIDLLRKIIDY